MSRTDLAKQALEKSLEVREEFGYDFRSPLCVYEVADRAGVRSGSLTTSAWKASMQSLAKPKILISSLRPAAVERSRAHMNSGIISSATVQRSRAQGRCKGRRVSTERVYRRRLRRVSPHASTSGEASVLDPGLDVTTATAEQIYAVASSFGVGYETIVGHLEYSLGHLTKARPTTLRRAKLRKFVGGFSGSATPDHLIVRRFHSTRSAPSTPKSGITFFCRPARQLTRTRSN